MSIYSSNRLVVLLSNWVKTPDHWAILQGIYTCKSGILAETARILMNQQLPVIWTPRKMPKNPVWLRSMMQSMPDAIWLFDEWTIENRLAIGNAPLARGAFAHPGSITPLDNPAPRWPSYARDRLAVITLTPVATDEKIVRWDWKSPDGVLDFGWVPRGPWPAPVLPANIAAWDFGCGSEAIAYPAPPSAPQAALLDPWEHPVYYVAPAEPTSIRPHPHG